MYNYTSFKKSYNIVSECAYTLYVLFYTYIKFDLFLEALNKFWVTQIIL